MHGRLARLILAPIALALASFGLVASPASAITGPNLAPDTTHTYVGLIAFYDETGTFVHRCTGTLLSDRVFLTAGHCVTLDDEGTLATSARIWFEQDAGADYDPVTGTPASSGYPVSGGVVATQFYDPEFRGLVIPDTHDVGLVVLAPGALAAAYPALAGPDAEYGQLAPVDTSVTDVGTGKDAVVDVSGYGVSRQVGKNAKQVVSYRSRLGGSTFVINNHNSYTAGFNLQLASSFGDGRVGTCFGDSGGPTFVGGTNVILAVNSFVKNYSCGGQGFVYRVDTDDVQTWMQEVLGPLWADIAP